MSAALRHDPRTLFEHMYGNEPERWDERLTGYRAAALHHQRADAPARCAPRTGASTWMPRATRPPPTSPLRPWFEHPARRSRGARVIFGHWSALGLVQAHGVVGLDTGCVWGGALTALDLDAQRPPVSLQCAGYQRIGAD